MITRARKSRARKRHVQEDLLSKLDKNGQRRGVGPRKRRPGVKLGRPPKNPRRSSEKHKRREELDRRHPQHVTLRVTDRVGYLRKPHMYRAIRGALRVALERDTDDFRIVHFSIQGNHIHVVCEAENQKALTAGMTGFEISAAKRLNDELIKAELTTERGQVFADRYHVTPITSV